MHLWLSNTFMPTPQSPIPLYICFQCPNGVFQCTPKDVMHTLIDLVAEYRHVLIFPVILACLHTRLSNRISMPAVGSAPPLNT